MKNNIQKMPKFNVQDLERGLNELRSYVEDGKQITTVDYQNSIDNFYKLADMVMESNEDQKMKVADLLHEYRTLLDEHVTKPKSDPNLSALKLEILNKRAVELGNVELINRVKELSSHFDSGGKIIPADMERINAAFELIGKIAIKAKPQDATKIMDLVDSYKNALHSFSQESPEDNQNNRPQM